MAAGGGDWDWTEEEPDEGGKCANLEEDEEEDDDGAGLGAAGCLSRALGCSTLPLVVGFSSPRNPLCLDEVGVDCEGAELRWGS